MTRADESHPTFSDIERLSAPSGLSLLQAATVTSTTFLEEPESAAAGAAPELSLSLQTFVTCREANFDTRDDVTNDSAVEVTTRIETRPANLQFFVDGDLFRGIHYLHTKSGRMHRLGVPAVQEDAARTTRHYFIAWSDGGAPSHSIRARLDVHTVVGVYSTEYKVNVNVEPAGAGSVGASTSAGDGFYAAGTELQLNAVAEPGYRFIGFDSHNACELLRTEFVVDSPKTITAIFERL